MIKISNISSLWRCGPTMVRASSFLTFLDHTQRRITVGRTPMYGWSARCRDFFLTTHDTHNRQTSMPPVGFESAISEVKRQEIHALDRTTTNTGFHYTIILININFRAGRIHSNWEDTLIVNLPNFAKITYFVSSELYICFFLLSPSNYSLQHVTT